MECSQVYKILANESHNDKLKLLISKNPVSMQLQFNDSLNIDEQQNGITNNSSTSSSIQIMNRKINNKWETNNNGTNNDKLNNLYITSSCKTTAL